MQVVLEPDRQTVWLVVPEPATLDTAEARVLVLDDGTGRAKLPRLTLPLGMWVAAYYETTSPWGKESLTWGPHHLRRVLKALKEG